MASCAVVVFVKKTTPIYQNYPSEIYSLEKHFTVTPVTHFWKGVISCILWAIPGKVLCADIEEPHKKTPDPKAAHQQSHAPRAEQPIEGAQMARAGFSGGDVLGGAIEGGLQGAGRAKAGKHTADGKVIAADLHATESNLESARDNVARTAENSKATPHQVGQAEETLGVAKAQFENAINRASDFVEKPFLGPLNILKTISQVDCKDINPGDGGFPLP